MENNLNDLVSIIIPVYNSENYIEKTVQSLFNQTYKNIEIILVNDSSTDKSDAICKKLLFSNKNIKYLSHKKNLGQTITRNDGIDLSEGSYIMFLDADDYLKPFVIKEFVERIVKDKSDIVFAGYETYDENNNTKTFLANIKEGIYFSKDFVSHLFDDISSNVLTCIGSKIYNSNFVKNKKQKTSEEVKTNYDMAFVIDALISAERISYINKPTYSYFQHSGSITHSYRKNMYSRICFARKRVKELLIKYSCFESKKKYYYNMQYANIMWSITQEVKFAKDYQSFSETFQLIRKDSFGRECINTIIKSNYSIKQKILMSMIKLNMEHLMWLLLVIHKAVRKVFK